MKQLTSMFNGPVALGGVSAVVLVLMGLKLMEVLRGLGLPAVQ